MVFVTGVVDGLWGLRHSFERLQWKNSRCCPAPSSEEEVQLFGGGSTSDVTPYTLSKSTLEPLLTLEVSSSPRDTIFEFGSFMSMNDESAEGDFGRLPCTKCISASEHFSTLDILSSQSSTDAVNEFENTMLSVSTSAATYTISKSALDPLSLSQYSRDAAIELGSITAMNGGSTLQAPFDPRFIYTYTLVLAAVLLIMYKVMRASTSSSNAESVEERLLFLYPNNLHEHRDHHRRSRVASSDMGDESVLSISDDANRSAVFEEDFQLEQVVPEATAAFEEEDLQLEQLVPEATAAERLRFLVAKKGNVRTASKSLKAYLQWRSDHQHIQQHGEPALLELELYTEDSDWNDWNIASTAACKANKETSGTILPRIARLHKIEGNDIRDRQGYRVLRLISGQMDDRLVSLTTYATAVALYIDRKLARESTETVTLCIDLRGGPGWMNLHIVKVLPFIRTTTKLLLTMFPLRLERAVVYPLTPAFRWIWPICKQWIDPLTAEKICILTGPATIVSPPPLSQMIQYLDESIVALLEKAREADFVTSSPEDSLQQS
jgi:hypothetical protein